VDMMNSLQTSTVTQGTIECILWAVRNNGLEKTLQDLRGIMPDSQEYKNIRGALDNNIYEGMLKSARRVKDLVDKSREDKNNFGKNEFGNNIF